MQHEQQLRANLRKDPSSAAAHAALALHFLTTGRAAYAAPHFAQAIRAGQTIHHIGLARAHLESGQLDRADKAICDGLGCQNPHPDLWLVAFDLHLARHDLDAAKAALAHAKRLAPRRDLSLADARLAARAKAPDDARKALADAKTPLALIERGKLREKAGDHAGAWADWTEAKHRTGTGYDNKAAKALLDKLAAFWSHNSLPPARTAHGAQPIFIVGYPRSGTTLTEQILSAHPDVTAGDELPFLNALTKALPALMPSPLPYPDCLGDTIFADRADIATRLRDDYLRRADARGLRGRAWFTDKMPMNETHLPLIAAMFPASPIFHVIRDPRDVLISNFGNLLSHGFNQASAPASIARHYVRLDALVAATAPLCARYRPVRYEMLVSDPYTTILAMLDHAGLSHEDACLSPQRNPNAPRTPSAAAVADPINTAALGRWQGFKTQIGGVQDILHPALTRLGYL